MSTLGSRALLRISEASPLTVKFSRLRKSYWPIDARVWSKLLTFSKSAQPARARLCIGVVRPSVVQDNVYQRAMDT